MNVCGQQVAQGVVNQAVTGYRGQTVEAGRGDPDMKVTAAIPGSGVPGVEVAFVRNFQE